jgi:hypothetical protein
LQIHPTVNFFLGLSRERLVARYCHNHPKVDKAALSAVLSYAPAHMFWAGADLMHVTSCEGQKSMVLIETNSCPSGQKSMPLENDRQEQGGYRVLLQRSLLPRLPPRAEGALAIVYDKNPMEASGYAAALADLMGETVHLVPFMHGAAVELVRFAADGAMEVREATLRDSAALSCSSGSVNSEDEMENEGGSNGRWVRIRGGVRYVTERPWSRIPVHSPTVFLNGVLACLAGGRNKIVAARAYAAYGAELATARTGLAINTPHTLWNVPFDSLRACVARLGGFACIKVPYSNAGQGVYTITSEAEFADFEAANAGSRYERYLVQSLISNSEWSSVLDGERLYHVGTVPDKRGRIFVADLRMMVSGGADGFACVGMYARKAPAPLSTRLEENADSWSQLGTNLSVSLGDGKFTSAPERLLLMDRRDFDELGIGLDELIDAFVQTCLATISIDRMGAHLCTGGVFDLSRLAEVNDDPGLAREIMRSTVA